MRNVNSLLKDVENRLKANEISEPALNAEWIVSKVCGLERLQLRLSGCEGISEETAKKAMDMALMRIKHVPLSYIFGEHNFRGFSLEINRGVFVPRPETEELIDIFLKCARKNGKMRILDFGTGSGAIAILLAAEIKEAEIIAVDKSVLSIRCAERNVKKHGFSERVKVQRGESPEELGIRFDFIISNPPYIPSPDIEGLDAEVRMEPRVALDGRKDGLKVVRKLLRSLPLC